MEQFIKRNICIRKESSEKSMKFVKVSLSLEVLSIAGEVC